MPKVPVYQSVQTNGTLGASTVVTKPVSLAVGDLMVAQVMTENGVPTTPTGWTLADSRLSGTLYSYLFYKVATSGDVAATNFTFAAPSASSTFGSITRITNYNTAVPIDRNNGNTGTTAYPTVSTVTPTLAPGLFMIFAAGYNGSSVRTSSGYAIVTNNPTWTEAYDSGQLLAGNYMNYAMAYANRQDITATGNITATVSGTEDRTILQFLSIPAEPITTIPAISAIIGGTTIRKVLDITMGVLATMIPPIASEIPAKWKNVTKHISDWTNLPKS